MQTQTENQNADRWNQTAAERAANRARYVERLGYDPTIQESTRDAIRAVIDSAWIVTREEFTCSRLNFDVNPRSDVSGRKRFDLECELSRTVGNPPHSLATEFTSYRLTFFAN